NHLYAGLQPLDLESESLGADHIVDADEAQSEAEKGSDDAFKQGVPGQTADNGESEECDPEVLLGAEDQRDSSQQWGEEDQRDCAKDPRGHRRDGGDDDGSIAHSLPREWVAVETRSRVGRSPRRI